ncbi:MAG: MarR family transcriptional regulator [Gemmatimonadaceae bacterium]|nr:MarR family transcriptional regulator [Gemmatimonadaceae bacterium]MCW5826493.1 MarR family transcriptional regulator [Gemmatimonadaceae bacterium]
MTSTALRSADPEAHLVQEDHEALRLWLRLFTTTTMVERVVDSTLKREFGSSLPRFDLLSQLHRTPDGLRMGALSERILVTNGNVTWLVAALEREGFVKRRPDVADRRATVVRLTAAGKRHFETMARRHEALIVSLFADLSATERRALHAALGTLKARFRPSQDAR